MNLKIDGNGGGNLWDVVDPDRSQPDISRMLLNNPMLQNEIINYQFTDVEGTSSLPCGYAGYGVPRLDTALSFNYYSSQSGKSEVPAESPTSNIYQVKRTITNEKKKEADRNYRTRQKEGKQKLIGDLSKFEEENMLLTSQNKILKNKKDEMDKDLQSANAETKRLKTEISKLKCKSIVQETLVETFSQKVIDNDREGEIAVLKRKFAMMSEQTKWESWMSEKEELLKKVASLEYQNKILKVQVNTLCLRISNPTEVDSDKS
jgi:chromosome segregation ATPase